MEELQTVITFTVENAEFKAVSHFHGHSSVIEVTQSVGVNLFPIVTIKINGEYFDYEWHTNPLYDVNELRSSTQNNELNLMWSNCTICTTVCDTIQGLGCTLAGTAACMVACAPIGTVACPFICAAVFGLVCLSENKITCGPGCKSLGFC